MASRSWVSDWAAQVFTHKMPRNVDSNYHKDKTRDPSVQKDLFEKQICCSEEQERDKGRKCLQKKNRKETSTTVNQ